MCYFLYGAVNGKVDTEALEAVNDRHVCSIVPGTRHALKMAILSGAADFFVTDRGCDCECDIGEHDPGAEQVTDLAGLIREISALPGAESISISYIWIQTRNKSEQTVPLSGIDLCGTLADLPCGTLLTIRCKA